jgi:HD-like signal output (HDOD) protein
LSPSRTIPGTEPALKSPDAGQTMELLWSQVRQRGDLPGFSKAVSGIIDAMCGTDNREYSMTQTVLSDPALTQKVLRLANSAMYSVFGQGINTISKAVIVLGTETIGHLALGLKLIDGLSSASSDSPNARSEMEIALLAGHIARQVAASAGMRDAEEAVVCSMLHPLGRMMVTFYLPEQWHKLQEHRAATGADYEQAARDVLGLELQDVGRLAAQQWGLPKRLINTLKDIPPVPVAEPLDHADWLAAVSTLSSRCAVAISTGDGSETGELLRLASDYAEMLGLAAGDVLAAVDAAKNIAAEEDLMVLRPARRAELDPKVEAQRQSGKPPDAAAILERGVADVRDASPNANSGQLITMALEAIYQGLGFGRTIAFLRDQERSQYAARMWFGEGVKELLPRLIFDDAYQPDVFHAALASDKIIFVEHAQDRSFMNKVPRWWKEAMPEVRSFVVLPLTVNRLPVGFVYGDWNLAMPAAKIESTEIAALNELRSLLMLAMEQRRRLEPLWARRML